MQKTAKILDIGDSEIPLLDEHMAEFMANTLFYTSFLHLTSHNYTTQKCRWPFTPIYNKHYNCHYIVHKYINITHVFTKCFNVVAEFCGNITPIYKKHYNCHYIMHKYINITHVFTKCFNVVAEFCGNMELCRLTKHVVFLDPYKISEFNHWTLPYLDYV